MVVYKQTFLFGGVPGIALLSAASSSSLLAPSPPFYNTVNHKTHKLILPPPYSKTKFKCHSAGIHE